MGFVWFCLTPFLWCGQSVLTLLVNAAVGILLWIFHPTLLSGSASVTGKGTLGFMRLKMVFKVPGFCNFVISKLLDQRFIQQFCFIAVEKNIFG